MVAKRDTFLESDLFPRGAGKGSTPRVRKRDGEILFGPEKKRQRRPDDTDDVRLSDTSKVTQNGASLSISRVSLGMTLLALVTRANSSSIDLALPSGLRAVADPNELLVDVSNTHTHRDAVSRAIERDVSDSDSDNDSTTADENDDDDNRISPLWRVLSIGQMVRAAVMDIEQNENGKKILRVSLKPELVNIGMTNGSVLQKGFPVYAAVKSVEDHGYVLSFGSSIVHSGFLPFENFHRASDDLSDDDDDHKLRPGHPIEVVVERDVSLPQKRRSNYSAAVRVTAHPKSVLAARVELTEGLNYQQLRAGMLVKARVMDQGPGGVALKAFGLFSIAVDAAHVPRAKDGSWDVTVGKSILTRFLTVDPVQKRIIATLLPGLVHRNIPRSMPEGWRIGTIMKYLKVDNVKPGFGLILSYLPHSDADEKDKEAADGDQIMEDVAQPTDGDLELNVPLFAHISRVSDSAGIQIESKYHKDMIITTGARIVSISRFDGIINVDLRSSVLARKALTLDEVEIGALYDCKIMTHSSIGSLVVAIDGDPHMVGMIGSIHISDVPIPMKRLSKHASFSIGATIRCRVLSLNPSRGKAYLSAKKSLVSPKFPLLTSYEDAEIASKPTEGSQSENQKELVFSGSVCAVTEKGNVLVEFCNRVVGLVPTAELCMDLKKSSSEYTRADIESVYPVGQTVNVRVLNVDSKHRRIVLSMRLPTIKTSLNLLESDPRFKLANLVQGKLTGVDSSSKHFIFSVSSSRSSIEIKDPVDEDTEMSDANDSTGPADGKSDVVECHLPFGHLSDVSGMAERLASELITKMQGKSAKSDEMIISEAMVLAVRDTVPILTLKQSLITAANAEALPLSFEQVVAKEKESGSDPLTLRGYVKALLPKGVIIGFLGDCVGFVGRSRIADRFVGDPARALKMNQSVSANLHTIDSENKRFNVSLKQSDVGSHGIIDDTLALFGSFNNLIMNLGNPKMESRFPIGAVVDAIMDAEHAYGVVYKLKASGKSGVGVVLDVKESNPDIILDEEHHETRKIKLAAKKSKASGHREKEKVRVLDVDPITGVVDVSRDEKVISGGAKKSVLIPGQKYSATVLLVKSSHIILAVARSERRSAIAFAIRPFLSDQLILGPGTKLQCTVLEKSPQTRRNLVVIDWQAQGISKPRNRLPIEAGNPHDAETIELIRSCGPGEEKTIIGQTVPVKVSQAFPLYVFAGVAPGIVGQIHVSNTASVSADELESIAPGLLPDNYASRFKLPSSGSVISPAYVVGLRTNLSPSDSTAIKLELSIVETGKNIRSVVEQEKVVGFVKRLSSRFSASSKNSTASEQTEDTSRTFARTIVSIGPSTVVFCEDIDSLPLSTNSTLNVGTPVTCLVTRIPDDETRHIHGVISNNGADHSDWFQGIVQDISPGFGVKVAIPWLARHQDWKNKSWGNVDVFDVANDTDTIPEVMSSLKPGDVVKVRHGSKSPEGTATESEAVVPLSMRRDDKDASHNRVILPENAKSLKPGTPICGFVRTVGKKGCFVAIGRGVVAKILLCDLSDDFVVNPSEAFPAGTLVKGKVGKVESTETGVRITMVLRTRPRKQLKGGIPVSDMKEGDLVRGKVKRIERYGAFVELSEGVSALLHISQADQDRIIEKPLEEWKVGQVLNAVVIKVKNGKVCIGTKRCYFEAAGVEEERIDELLEKNENMDGQAELDEILEEKNTNAAPEENATQMLNEGNDSESETDEESDEDDVVESVAVETKPESAPPLQISAAFNFSDKAVEVDEAEEPKEEDIEVIEAEKPQKKSRDKREKKRQREAAETEIRLREEALATNPDSPETSEDFERILVGEPNSSVVWIRYMAFCLSISQVEKARAVAERALQTISLSNEIDRTNVWIAYINLEAQYGASNSVEISAGDALKAKRDAAVFRVFERACERVTDVKNFHLQTASALRNTSAKLADEVLRRAVRKFKTSKKVWIALGQSQFMTGNKGAAQRTLERAIMSLEKRKHVAVISKFAQLEYKYGSVERGRTVFESLVGNFPKRLDLWNVYIDMETVQCRKANDKESEVVQKTRELLERCTTLDQSSKKMKFVFKKWLSFEKEFGNKEQQKEVKKLAREYVERSVAKPS